MRTVALELGAMGIHVFPLVANGKTPATPNGFKAATKDPERIEKMWRHRPEANIGVATGASNLVVIDVDVKHGVNGWAAFDDCIERLGELPGPTRMASTPSGGAHLYFREPAGFEVPLSTGRLGPGLDVRARGGYVVAAPSVIDGKAYRWDITERAKVLPVAWAEAMMPPKLVSMSAGPRPRIGSVSRYGTVVLRGEADAVAKAQPGQRNDTLTRSAFRVGTIADRCGITAEQSEEMFRWAVSQWGDAGELRKSADTFRRAFEAGRENPRDAEVRSA